MFCQGSFVQGLYVLTVRSLPANTTLGGKKPSLERQSLAVGTWSRASATQ